MTLLIPQGINWIQPRSSTGGVVSRRTRSWPAPRGKCLRKGAGGPPRHIRSSPLGFAVELNDKAMAELLLAHASPKDLQVPLRTSGPGGRDPLLMHSAVRSGNPEWVTTLADRGIPADGRNLRGETAFHEAARLCNGEMVKVLLRRGADPRIKNDDGARPLDKAAIRFYADMAELLRESAAD